MPTEAYWRNPRCELDGGLGAPVEERAVGTDMVCENGHHWIAYRLPANPFAANPPEDGNAR